MSKKISENNLVVKSNCLIEASYKLTLQEQRIILFMVSMIERNDEDFKPIKITIEQFTKLTGATGSPKYDQMEEITNKLRKRDLIINTQESKLQIGWLSSAEYFKGKGYVELCFDPKLKPYLLQLKERFTKYRLKNVLQLSHSYSICFYELLKQYEDFGYRIFELQELREMLGIPENKYSLYSNFKLKVLEPVKKELKIKAKQGKINLSFEYEEIKLCRKVAKIKCIIFTHELISEENNIGDVIDLKPINLQSVKPPQFDERTTQVQQPEPKEATSWPLKQSPQSNELLKLLLSFKVSKAKGLKIFKQYPAERIKQNIDYTESQLKLNKVDNPPAYIVKAIEEDYYATSKEKAKTDQEIEREQQKQQRIESVKTQQETATKKLQDEVSKFEQERKIDQAISAFPESDRKALCTEAESNVIKQLGVLPVDANRFIKKNRQIVIEVEMQRIFREKYL